MEGREDSCFLKPELANLNDLIINILGILGRMVSVAVTQLCCCSVKAAIDSM